MTTKIWPASAAEIARCLEQPTHVEHLFSRCEDYAMIHDSRALESLLRELARDGAMLREVPKASDASYVIAPGAVAKLAADETHRAILAFRSICVNGVQTAELVERAVASGSGLVFCVYEDW